MVECKQISQEVLVGPQPDKQGLRELADDGVASVLNLRPYDDDEESLPPHEEGILAQQIGMEYLSMPISDDELTPHYVADFRAKLDFMAKPVFVHCGSGEVATAFVLMDLAAQDDWPAEKTLQKARQLEYEPASPELRALIQTCSENTN